MGKYVRKNSLNLTRANVERVRKLRTEMSVSEQVLWAVLRKGALGFKFRRQHPVGPYSLDFYCPEAAVCVEVDGEQHRDRVMQDARRDAWLLERGIVTVRIPSLCLFDHNSAEFSRHMIRLQELCKERGGRA